MSSTYADLGAEPCVGDGVIVMKGTGPGGNVLGMFDRWVVIDQSQWGKVPMLAEPESLLLDKRDGKWIDPPSHWKIPPEDVSPLTARGGQVSDDD